MRKLDYKKLAVDIQDWIRDYAMSANAKGVVIGLSGGIDSAVTAALCSNALGKENVIGLGLPCESVSQDLEDAKLIAKVLGINFKIIDLTLVYNKFLEVMEPIVKTNKMASANLKSRLRMATLYFHGQSRGNHLIAGTGNRAELAIGYFTKYGDGGVDFEPIGMLYKNEVREIARILKIPEKIILKPPSPGLWVGQTDEGEIGLLYDTIDEILYRSDYNLGFNGLNKEDIEKVRKMRKIAEHKLQIPPMYEIK
jgi:NAD+ synthase